MRPQLFLNLNRMPDFEPSLLGGVPHCYTLVLAITRLIMYFVPTLHMLATIIHIVVEQDVCVCVY